jgi:hypothetical protein
MGLTAATADQSRHHWYNSWHGNARLISYIFWFFKERMQKLIMLGENL